jgi:hypothetical protein
VIQTDRYGNARILYEPPSELDKERLLEAEESRLARLSPEDRKAVAQVEANQKRAALKQSKFEIETNPLKRDKMEKDIALAEQKLTDPVEQRQRIIDKQMKILEEQGRTDTELYRKLQTRFDELGKVKSGATTVTVKTMPAGMVQRQANREAFLKIGRDILAKWTPEYTGPIQGRWLKWKNTWIGGDKPAAKFHAGVTSMLQSMYDRAGKQLSNEELAKWQPFLPKLEVADATFEGRMENLIENVATYLATESDVATRAGYLTGAAPTNNPSPKELRQRNSVEAYELGQQLGYWE